MIRPLFFLAVAAIFLASCGKKDEQGGKKVFRYNQTGGLNSLDPAQARNRASVWATSQIFNGLMELDENMHPAPAIAETYDLDSTGTLYTFKLKKGIIFHDDPCFPNGLGREVHADDFVYSFKRIINPKTHSTGAWIFLGKVHPNPDSAFVAVDRYTLQIRLKSRFAPFLEVLTMPYAFVIPKEGIEKYADNFRSHPIGTGAFKFKEWKEGEKLILTKNEHYWKKDLEGRKMPFIDVVQVSFINEPNQAYNEFVAGKLDFITGLPETAKEILDKGKIKEEYRKKYNVEKIQYMNTEYIGFLLNPKKYSDSTHPFLNKKFRQALSYAINREQLVLTLRNGLGTPGVSGITPAALPSFDSIRVKGYSYNLEKARQLLKEAGYEGGKGLPKLKINTYQTDKEIIEFVKKQWSEIGVDVTVESNQFVTHQKMVDEGNVTLFRGSWLGDYPDAENYFAMFFSENFSPVGPNKTNFKNATYDKLYKDAQGTQDNNEKNHLKLYEFYHQMDTLIVEEAPVIVLYYDEILRIYSKKLKGLKTNATNILFLENVDFGDDKPEEKSTEKTTAKN
ncbi:MAG: ABC transporter substrate-binding protein [Thermonemataceae bacterium]|nr:ABC transporter substrate-binding protein [Thermonemataceae bacterium]